jgi:hypothetical protein
MSEDNKEVTITDINIPFATVFRIAFQLAVSLGSIGGLIWWLFFVGRDWWI